jgi:hypothetical protein
MEDGQFERLLAEIAESRRQTEEGFAAGRRYTDEVAERLRQEMRQLAADTRREFHVVAESFRSTTQLLAEGFAMVDAKVDRLGVELRAEIKSEGAAIRSLLKLAYSDLDRRVTRLEGGLHPE